jgi:DNA-binding response OmpR family regulator
MDAKLRILYIEDEIKLARFVQQALDEEGHLTDVATDGLTGYEMARSQLYQLVIVDNLLPSMSGLEICRELRGEGHKVPILMLTALDSVDQKVAGLDAGADDYLPKPFALAELQARVRALTRRRQDQSSLVTVDDLTLDVLTREVRHGNRLIQLSAREFSLLEYLMRNAGHPLSRAAITENVWGLDFDPETNVIDVYINYLRTKIDSKRTKKLIRTIRGVGYSIG